VTTACVGASATAQEAKKPATKEAKDAKEAKDTKKTAPKAGGGTVEISEGKDGKFRFGVRDEDGKYLGGSGPIGYPSRDEAVKAIDRLKAALATAKVVDKKAAEDEKK
jgi:uncharacterized protein YegP (UPF0339 family)